MENQSYVDYRMVLRVMQEEVLGYERQRNEVYEKAKQEGYSFHRTENKLLFEVLANAADKNKVKQLFQEESENYSLDREAAAALIGMAGIKMDLDKLKEEKE